MDYYKKRIHDLAILGRLGRQQSDETSTWIQLLWFEFEQYLTELQPLFTQPLTEETVDCWGISSDQDTFLAPPEKEGLYLAGIQVKKGTVAPKGWTYWEIPDQDYLVLKTNVLLVDQTVKELFEVILPKEQVTLTGAIQEFYAATDTPGELWLYCPIESSI